MKKVLFLFFILWLPHALLAELPPSAYRDYKKNAPEVLTLMIENITTSTCASNKIDVTVIARVLTVFRSISNVKKGDLICINYQIIHRNRRGWAGPSSIPIKNLIIVNLLYPY